ncbi:ABC transporter permease [Reichenbachiella sp. MALMAid0571]|uniref:ABC transporter permease n=1 Tax=Reichenbachiella sp. MALMAid0571 TaxID=3143939 RepID=UPI0032E027A2
MKDKFCYQGLTKKESQFYQITRSGLIGNEIVIDHSTPGLLAESLVTQFPEVEYAVTVEPSLNNSWGRGVVSTTGEDNGILVAPHYVSDDFFDVFPYDLLQNAVIFEKNSVFISEKLALKLFNSTEDVLGKTVQWKDEQLSGQYTISGVFFSTPTSPSVPIDLLFSYENYLEKNQWLLNWSNYTSSTFVVLNEGANVGRLNDKISNFIRSKDKWTDADFFLKPYSDNGYQFVKQPDYIKIILAIAVCIVIIACINFINLSMVKSFMREREADLKKIFESRRQLVFQYIGELVLVTTISLPVAVLIIWGISFMMGGLTSKGMGLNLDTIFIVSAFSVALFIGFSILLNEQNQFKKGNSGDERLHKSRFSKLKM